MIREKTMFSCPGKVQLLLRDGGLDLKKTNKICQCLEQSNRQSEEIKKDNQASVYSQWTQTSDEQNVVNKDVDASLRKPIYILILSKETCYEEGILSFME